MESLFFMLSNIDFLESNSCLLNSIEPFSFRIFLFLLMASSYFLSFSINVSYPNNIQKRGRVGKQVSQTILASNNNIAVLESTPKNNLEMFNPYNHSEVKSITPTQTANCGNIYSSSAVLISEDGKQCFRIRKLTPKECWRLMRFFR